MPEIADVLQLGPALGVRGGISSVERLIMEHAGSSVAIRHVATMEDGSSWRKLRVFLRALSDASGVLGQKEPLVVHIHFSKRGSTARKLILAWMTLRARRPLILHAHSGGYDEFFARLPASAQGLLRRVFSRADCMVVLSDYWREFYVRRFGLDAGRVVVLHNPVALPAFLPVRSGRAQVQLLYLGRISEHKGAFDLLRAYRALPPGLRARTRLVLAGDGKVEELREQAREFGTAVEVHSWVDSRRRDALLAASDIFVLPSYYEGVPMAMLEAMAHGLPVVTTRVGGIPDIVDDQVEGLLVAPGESAPLQAALCTMIEDENRRLAFGRCARARAENFDVRVYASDLVRIYRQLLDRRGDVRQGSLTRATWMQRLQWYVNRLGRMSPAELTYRLAQAARASAGRWADPAPALAPAPQFARQAGNYIKADTGLDAAAYVAQADDVIAGRFSIFGLKHGEPGDRREWNRDPLTGRLAPLLHAASLDYRDEEVVGSIKHLWEPNRHLHLPQLAQAYSLTGQDRYALEVKAQVDSWIEQCPCGRGPNWSSSLELAIRLINWSIAWQLLGGASAPLFVGAEGREFRDRWLRSVYQHARSICGKLSRFSSANNHLIGEAAGVWIASVTWNCWPQMRTWGSRCRRLLIEEAHRQNAEDGGNREQAFAYQQFVLDFLLLAGLAARAAGEDFPEGYWQRIERMIGFIASMMDVAGHVPMIGDADDGYVVNLAPQEQFDNYRSLLATGALLFGRADFAGKAGRLDDKTRWLLGKDAVSRFAAARGLHQPQRAFPDAGYYLLGDRFETPDEVRLLVDAGPLGYLSIAAHGHADALSVVLNVGGHEVLIDPGTYAYHTEPEWRAYFRSTRAHNTLSIDGQDQSRQSGKFMWSRHASARCLRFELDNARQQFIGEHDGYRSLADPVTHRREIVYDTRIRTFTIVDTLACTGAHQVCRHWHFAETVQPVVDGDEIRVRAGRHLIRLVPAEAPAGVERYEGGTAGEGGWVSRRFGRKVPATTIGWRSQIQGATVLRTHIYVEEAVGG